MRRLVHCSWFIALTAGCSGNQTFDDGSDKIARRPQLDTDPPAMDAGPIETSREVRFGAGEGPSAEEDAATGASGKGVGVLDGQACVVGAGSIDLCAQQACIPDPGSFTYEATLSSETCGDLTCLTSDDDEHVSLLLSAPLPTGATSAELAERFRGFNFVGHLEGWSLTDGQTTSDEAPSWELIVDDSGDLERLEIEGDVVHVEATLDGLRAWQWQDSNDADCVTDDILGSCVCEWNFTSAYRAVFELKLEQDGTPMGDASDSSLEFGPDIEGQTLDAAVGDSLTLRLQTIGPGNYEDPQLDGDAVTFDGSELPAMQNPGGPTQLFHFTAVQPGLVAVTVPHTFGSPFTFSIDVE